MIYFIKACNEYDWGAPFEGGRTGIFRVECESLDNDIDACKSYMKNNTEDFDEDLCSFSNFEFYNIV